MPFKKYVTQTTTFMNNPRLIMKTPQDTVAYMEAQGKKVTKGRPCVVTDVTAMNAYNFAGFAHENILVGYTSTTVATFDTSGVTPVLVATKAIPALDPAFNQRAVSKMMKPYGGRSPLVGQYNTAGNITGGWTVAINSDGTFAANWDRGTDLFGRNIPNGGSTIVDADGQCVYRHFDQVTGLWKFAQLQMTDSGYIDYGVVNLPGSEQGMDIVYLPFHTGKTSRTFAAARGTAASNIYNIPTSATFAALYDLGVPTMNKTVTEITRWTAPTSDPIRNWVSGSVAFGELNGGVYGAMLNSGAVVDGNSRNQFTWYHDIFGTPEVGSVMSPVTPPTGSADAGSLRLGIMGNHFGKGFGLHGGAWRGTFLSDRFYFHWLKPKIGRLRVYDGTMWRKA